ncbi:MAG: hypothetical protein AAF721_24000 [Myxococcota bacterium]
MNAWIARRLLTFALFAPLAASGCGHTQMVVREPSGGQLALKGSRRAAMRVAAKQMDEHCGSAGYHITREEMVVLGTKRSTVAQFGAGAGGFGGQYVESEGIERELRVTYLCGDGSQLALGR